MPAKVLEKMRPTTMAGLAKLVLDVKKYAAPIYAPTAAATFAACRLRVNPKMTSTSPSVATTSASQWAAELRCVVEIDTADRANMRFAKTAPPMQPATWAPAYSAASRQASRPKNAKTAETNGLKCAPETGAHTTIST